MPAFDPGRYAPDLNRLLPYSKALRATLAMLERNPDKTSTPEGVFTWQVALNNARLEQRVAIDHPAGGREPRNDGEALRYMQAPEFMSSRHYEELQRYRDRRGSDARLLLTVRAAIKEARRLNVPLWPSLLADPPEAQAMAFVTGLSELPPGASPYGTGRVVQLGHCTLRQLPWLCWALVDAMVARAGASTGFRLLPVPGAPGEFELPVDAPELRPEDLPLRPVRLDRAAARDEADRLWRYYSGGEWEGAGDVVDGHGADEAGEDKP